MGAEISMPHLAKKNPAIRISHHQDEMKQKPKKTTPPFTPVASTPTGLEKQTELQLSFSLRAICVSLELDESLLPKTSPPVLTEKQREILTATFQLLRQSIEDIGVVVFMRTFEAHPQVRQVFESLKDVSEESLIHSRELKSHAFRVVGFVEKCIARLHQPVKLESLLHDLGRHHAAWKVLPEYLDLLALQFVAVMKSCLGDKWNSVTEEAWMAFFSFITHYMKEAMKPRHSNTTGSTLTGLKAS